MATPDSTRFCISNLMSAATIRLQLRGRDREEVLQELIGAIPELAARPDARVALFKALVERELLHSTGVGDGVALPHARQALTHVVEHPVIVLGRHPTGIAYGAIDGQPVKLFLLLVTTAVTEHLQVLARISRLIRNPDLQQNLLTATHPQVVLNLIRQAEEST
jgi:mannitol/fructose-specific phosphotransferase system IIA component (Ntr-type)